MRFHRLGPLWLALLVHGCSDAESALPAEYRDLAVPRERLESIEARSSGRDLFARHCAICHGERADGHGRRRNSLSTPPADFTRPDWRARTSEKDVYRVIREGVRGTAMPAWKALDPSETWDIVAYVLSVAETVHEPGAPPAGASPDG